MSGERMDNDAERDKASPILSAIDKTKLRASRVQQRAEAPAAGSADEHETAEPVDKTRVAPKAADKTRVAARDADKTRIVARTAESAPAARNDADRTRMAGTHRTGAPSVAADADGSAERTRFVARDRSGDRSAPSTGSDWAHPEHWEPRHEGGLEPGAVVKDRFVLESVLGQGGMGVVFRAVDRRKEEARDRDPYVAIKILSEEFRRHPNALIALQREARKAQTLAHPNVITVHDFDRDGTTVYMTMELLDGDPLNKVIAEHKLRGLPADEALRIVRGAAAALAYAHEKGIVHSDFKPGNVFVTRDGGVKVLDFGIARAVRTRPVATGDETAFDVGELGALTPAYASPEMLEGQEPVPADDVFALAIVACELLTGRHPFDRMPADEAVREGLKPPSFALKRRQRKALAKALSFDRQMRHADAAAFLRDLDGPSPLRKAAYGSALVAMATVAAYGLYYGNQLRPDVPFAELPLEVRMQFENAVAEGERALGFGPVGLNDAFDYFSRAYALHRNNPLAIAGLEDVADGFLRSMSAADAGMQRNVFKKLYCQEYLASYPPVVDACRTTLGAAQCSAAALGCPVIENP